MIWHLRIYLFGKRNEPCLEPVHPRFPGQVMRVERNAVTANSGTRVESHEPEWLGSSGLNDLPGIYSEGVAELRHFVDQPYVDRSEGVLEQFACLGHTCRADLMDLVNDCTIGCHSNLSARTTHSTNDLGNIVRMELRIARVYSLGRAGAKVVAVQNLAHLIEHRPQDFVRCARIGRRFQDDQLSWSKCRLNLLCG